MKKQQPLIPPPARDYGRLPRVGKHSLGKAPLVILGRREATPRKRKRDLGDKRRAKAAFLATSSAQGNAIAKEKADAKTYRAWFETLSAADQAFAREHGIDKPLAAHGRPGGATSDPDVEFCDPADLHAASVECHPVDLLEPEACAVELENLSATQIRDAADTFGDALRWALDPSTVDNEPATLVDLGKRSAVVIAAMRGDLAGGLFIDGSLARFFLARFEDFRIAETLAQLHATGEIYGRFLEWMRRAGSLSALGERLQLVAYELRPDLIDAGTLAKLGEATNKTRQAKDKGVNCLRDTFAGLKAIAMRADITRIRCKAAQLQTTTA